MFLLFKSVLAAYGALADVNVLKKTKGSFMRNWKEWLIIKYVM